MKHRTISISTKGERFYNFTALVRSELSSYLTTFPADKNSGILHIFVAHTSCALTINEADDDKAHLDCESFLKHVAPRNLSFITHVDEGPDDSPSHMKTMLLQPSLSLIIENGELVLGTWQGIYLAEFRDGTRERTIHLKFMPDMY